MLLLGLLVLLITFFFGDQGLYHLYTLKSERKRIQAEIDYLRNQRITLEDEKTRLKTDYKHIEEMAREKYRMAKKGEKVFKVIEKKED
ncbi:MAG: septum formation initiator family protein [Candidatus Neomarinimicrobiota bacterium]|nr:septum formation initiator family protein [Candidatus Neomarinimicrobiota bacterium]